MADLTASEKKTLRYDATGFDNAVELTLSA